MSAQTPQQIDINQQRLLKIILSPITSEKGTRLSDKHRQFIFKVAKDATKPEIKGAVEKVFNVKVKAVQVLNVEGKEKRFKQKLGRHNHWKKAYISLQEGFDIDFTGAKGVAV